MSSIIRTVVRTPSWEREESVAARPEYGEDSRGKGKGGKGEGRWVKKGEVVKFGEVMSRKDKELMEARVKIVRAIAEGAELANDREVEPENRKFFEKMERGFHQVEEERSAANRPKVWERAGLGTEQEDRKDNRGRRKERKRDSKEGRNRERRESRDEGERRYRERKDSKEGRRRKEERRSSSRSDD